MQVYNFTLGILSILACIFNKAAKLVYALNEGLLAGYKRYKIIKVRPVLVYFEERIGVSDLRIIISSIFINYRKRCKEMSRKMFLLL